MINFHGTTKRRNINLGNSRKTLKNSNKSYLDQLDQERRNRTRAKEELNAAIRLQSAIRSHQHLKQVAKEMKDHWEPLSMDRDQSLREFAFFSSKIASSEIEGTMDVLLLYYKSIDLSAIPSITLQNLFASLVILYSKLLNEPKHDHFKSISIIAQLALLSYKSLLTVEFGTMRDFLNDLNETLLRYSTKDTGIFIDALFCCCQHDMSSLLRFLNLDYSISLIEPLSEEQITKINSLRDYIASPEFDRAELSGQITLQFLGNFVELITTHHLLEPVSQTLKALSNVLKSIKSEVVFIEDLDDDTVMATEENDILVADFTLSKKLGLLYSKNFMSLSFKELEVSKAYDEFSQLLFSLLHMINGSKIRETNLTLKNKILTNLLVSTSCKKLVSHWFYEVLIKDEYAISLIEDTTSSRSMNLSDSVKWWETLYLFEEVLSYSLIFQNDQSVMDFGDSGMLPKFTSFLKEFCIRIAIDGKNISSSWSNVTIGENDFQHLCKLAFKLFNQLYLRNTRMNFVDDKFWHMDKALLSRMKFNTETVVKLLKRKELEQDDDGDDVDNINKRNSVFNRDRDDLRGALNILTYMPFLIPFETRAPLFQALIESDKLRKSSRYGHFGFLPQERLHAQISRDNLLFDAFEAYGDLSGEQFKSSLDVTFVNQFGPESGIDGGGLTKEFLTSVAKDGFQFVNFDDETLNTNSNTSDYNFFKQTPDTYQIYPSTDFYWRAKFQQQQTRLHGGKLEPSYDFTEENQFFSKMMRFLGMVIGKCLYENILLDVSFAPFFLSKWCSVENVESGAPQYKNSFDDLKYLDTKLYNSLIKLLSLNEKDLKDLELYFSISEKLPHQSDIVSVDLIPGGSSIQVDSTNKFQYVYALANFKLNTLINTQTKHFLSGLFEMIKPSWLNLFSHTELLMLVSGGDKPVDVEDLKANTVYGGFSANDKTITYFWEVVEEFSPEDRSKLIKFATSSSKAPLLGFKDLSPKFGIRDALDVNRLPTSSTCVNLLKLPDYKDKKILREKLLYAINAESGFDLS